MPGTGGWQTYTDVTVDLSPPAPRPGRCSSSPEPGRRHDGRLFNVNWVDFIGRGVTDNAPPAVTASATPPTGTAPLTVAFTGTATDAEGDTPLTYAWDFGDGGTADDGQRQPHLHQPGHLHRHPDRHRQPGRQARTPRVPVRVDAPNTSCFGARSDDFDGTALDRDRWTTVVRENQTLLASRRLAGAADRASVTSTAAATTPPTSCSSRPRPVPGRRPRRSPCRSTANYQQAGLIVYGDDDNYAKLDLLYNGSRRVEFIRETRRRRRATRRRRAPTRRPATPYYAADRPATART